MPCATTTYVPPTHVAPPSSVVVKQVPTLESYVAITSNTLQFGAQATLEVSAKVLTTTYTARGDAGTPGELLARATEAGLVRGTAAGQLTALFYEARFSSHPLGQQQRDAAERALDELAADLAETEGAEGAEGDKGAEGAAR